MQRPWPTIVFLWLVGVLAAAQLAKFAAIAPLLRDRFALSLPETGLLISLLEVGGGLFGFAAGLALGWIDCRRSLLAGMTLLAATTVLEAATTGPTLLFAARAVEGIGYLFVVIAAPTAIAALADDRGRARALALWSSFVPVGIAVGSGVTALGVATLGARGIMLLWAGLLAVAIVPIVRLRLPAGEGDRRRIVLPAAAAWVSTFAFGLYTVFLCALTMLLPTFLMAERGAALDDAGLTASMASLSALPASGIAILLIRRGRLSAGRLLAIAIPALAGTAMLVPLALGGSDDLATTSLIVIAAVLLSGLVSPLMFARLPILAGADSPHDPRIATSNGLLTQFGAGGALIGPPLGGLIVDGWGWTALGIAIAGLALLMLAGVASSEWIAIRSTRGRPVR